MSQFPSAPPPGAYIPPNNGQPTQGGFNLQQQPPQYGGYQQPQASTQYGTAAQAYGSSSSSHKPTNAFGQAFDQAVKQGKPMFNKLGKTISSKLGNKPLSSTPQHLESYNSYNSYQQQQQQQQQQHHQPHGYHAQGQQQNTYASPQQQSPYLQSQSNYATPASAQSGQNSYFGQQPPPPSTNSVAQQSQANPGYDPNVFTQGGGQDPGQPQQGIYNQAQSPFSHTQAGLNSGQQTGVIGGSQAPASFNSTPPPQNTSSNQQQPWSPPGHSQYTAQATSPAPQQQPFNHTPLPANQQQLPQPFNPTPPPQQYNTSPPPPPVPVHPNQQLQQQSQQQWAPTSQVSPQAHSPIPPVSPLSPPQSSQAQQQPPISPPPELQKQSKSSTPAPPPTNAEAAPTQFIAELPADLGNLSLTEASKTQSSASSPYQAYRPTSISQSPGAGFTVPRRAVSMSSVPLADPWRLADPATELPTREFYIIADLLFDTMDRKFAPGNTGLLEASKMLESWKAVGFADEAAELFAFDNFSAFARLWTLEEIPHMMVPCQSALTPLWNFQAQSHSGAIKMPMGSVLANPISVTYQPALNRAGYYKYLFLELMHEPENLEKMLSVLCADTYKPGVLNQPDVQKRDRTVLHGLSAQAAAIRSACISCVSQETAAQMQAVQRQTQQQGVTQAQQSGAASPPPPNGSAPMTDEERLVKMHSLKMQAQFNNMMATTMLGGGHYYGGPNYGSLV